MWMIDIARPLARLFYRVFYNLKVFGVENVPDKGGFIIASNHLSFHDPVIIAAFIKNGYVSFLAKQELFKNKLIGFFLKYLGAIPINRGARDAAAVKNAVDFIRAGNGLCIFPEGTRVKNGKEIRPKKGAVRMSQMSGVPIIPVHIKGGYRLFKKTELIVGKPLEFKMNKENDEKELMEKTNELMELIYSL